MTNYIRLMIMLGAILVAIAHAPSASAQATRTWVSGVGDDANPCSRTSPCKTFAGAISKTAAGGEIDALDPGGFGAVTITKSVTIDGGGGQVASVLVAGTNGIVVAAAGTDLVTLRNLRLNGISLGINGISFLSGAALIVENCDIFGFTQNGINIAPSSGTSRVAISNCTITNNTSGGVQVGPSGGTTNVTVSGVQANRNGFGIGVAATGAGKASVIVDHTTANENNSNGAQAAGAGSILLLSNSDLSHNVTGVKITSPAVGNTFLNNIIAQNSLVNIAGTLSSNTLK
jgi:hypothetical protein